MKDLFRSDGTPISVDNAEGDDIALAERSALLAEVVRTIDPDVLCITEGPNTLADGSKTARQQLEAWSELHGLHDDYLGADGIPSGGQQELCALYRSSKVDLVHIPEREARRNPFQKPFLVDTLDSLIKEQYKHYRPPFEISMRKPGEETELGRIIIAHAKSKGIFDLVDMARFEQLSERNRRKLLAECLSIRERCDQWLDENPDLKLVVCGDINDGFGLDYFEGRFSRSAVDMLLGDVWEPEKVLRHVLPRPKLTKYGWKPWSSDYKDRLTGDKFNVLIDHILVSASLSPVNGMVWNPVGRDSPPEANAIKSQLLGASDHFPVSVELDF